MPIQVSTHSLHAGPNPTRYVPQEDITAYELALILPLLLRAREGMSGDWLPSYLTSAVEELPEGARRHFQPPASGSQKGRV